VSDRYETILSHPAEDEPPDGEGSVRLETHLRAVGERARELVPEGATTREGDDLGEVAELLGRLHDFGKLTGFFQAYVRDKSPEEPTHHARLGAFVTYYVLGECGYGQQTRIAGTVAVWKHHGALPDVAEGLVDHLSGERTDLYEDVCRQADDIHGNRRELADEIFREATDGEASWSGLVGDAESPCESFESIRKSIENELLDRGLPRTEHVDDETYTDLLQLSSALVLADKSRAGDIEDEKLDPEVAELEDLENHLDGLGGDPENDEEAELNRLRDAAQDEVAENVHRFLDSDESVATVTLPTGYGKTLVGLRAALEMQAEQNTDGRIVYALPFTSIIDQTADTLRNVFSAEPTGRKLTIHHHLAETVTVGDDWSESDDDDASEANVDDEPTDEYAREEYLVGESWRSGLTLTTFVQLFESLAGPGNAQSMKLPAMYGSVVIVDEPQALPLRWWPLVERLVEVLTEVYDARVVLMTATQPEIVDDRFDLIRAKEKYFDGPGPDRVSYEFDSTVTADDDPAALGYDEAAGRLVAEAAGGTDSALAVCNTIDSARDLS
jgi:CRISPR-associated endonuclease/helicase Cas3/CRISPR-associated endonuclease Cas3-HD